MSFQNTAELVLAKARRVDEIAEELHHLLSDLQGMEPELWSELKKVAGGVGRQPDGSVVDWVGLRGMAKREITQAMRASDEWEGRHAVEAILLKAWGCLLADKAAQRAVEGN